MSEKIITIKPEKGVLRLYFPRFELIKINKQKNIYLILSYRAKEQFTSKSTIVTSLIDQQEKIVKNKVSFLLNSFEGKIKKKINENKYDEKDKYIELAINFQNSETQIIEIYDVCLSNDDYEYRLLDGKWSDKIKVPDDREYTVDEPKIIEDEKSISNYIKNVISKKIEYTKKIKILMIVGNGIVGDSRVLKTAMSLKQYGYAVLLLGVKKQSVKYECFTLEDLDCITTHNDGLSLGIDVDTHEKVLNEISVRLNSIYVEFKGNILYTHDYFGLDIGANIISEGYYKNTCYWIHDIHEYIRGYEGVIDPNRLKYAILVEEEKIKIPDKLVVVNEKIAALLCEEHGLDIEDIIILPNAPRMQIPIDGYSLRKKIGISKELPLGIYLGRATGLRGLDSLIYVLSEIKELHIVLFSSSLRQYTNELKQKANELGFSNRLHILDYVKDNEVAFAAKDGDFGLSPLKKYGNSDLAIPTKIYEYIHAELPIVASDTILQKEFIEKNDIGIIYSNNNPEINILNAIKEILSKNNHKNFKINCQKIKDKYTWEVMFLSIINFIKNIENFPIISIKSRGIFQGPVGSAGQPSILASALRNIGSSSQSISMHRHIFNYPTDIIWRATTIKSKASLFIWSSHRFDIFHFHFSGFFNFIDDNVYQIPSFWDLIILKALGKKIIFHFRGSEIRINSKFRKVNKFAWDEFEDPASPKMNDQTKNELINYITAIADAVLVVDPELQTYIPNSRILPRAFPAQPLRSKIGVEGKIKNKILKIVHAPSRRKAKGTESVINAITMLRNEGYEFNFCLIEKKSNLDVLDLISEADILIDQLIIGWYGVLAVEAFSMGIPVVSYIRDDLWADFSNNLPVINANQGNVYTVLKSLIDNPLLLNNIGTQSKKYFDDNHEATKVASMALNIYSTDDSSLNNLNSSLLINALLNNRSKIISLLNSKINNEINSNQIEYQVKSESESESDSNEEFKYLRILRGIFNSAISAEINNNFELAIKIYNDFNKQLTHIKFESNEINRLERLVNLRLLRLNK